MQAKQEFVLVHGAWHGAWCWDQVAERLTKQGHTATAFDLSGLGNNSDTDEMASIGLATHVKDVVDYLSTVDEPVILVGHSYSGMVATVAAAKAPSKVKKLVVVDGFIPLRGEKAVELLPDHVAAHYREAAEESGYVDMKPRPIKNLGVTDEEIITYVEKRVTPHPAMTYFEEAELGAEEVQCEAVYAICESERWHGPFSQNQHRAKESGWKVAQLEADHEIMLTDPELLTDLLMSEV